MYKFLTPLFFTTLFLFTGCLNDKKDSPQEATTGSAIYSYSVVNGRPAGWDDKTHGKDAEANYDVVFPQDTVNRIDITVSADQWKALMDDMTRIYGYAFGKGGTSVKRGITRDGLDMAENSIYIPANIKFNDKTWYCVGFRFKGNSSLSSAWSSGNYKMGIKLDFNEMEDSYPEIKNQTFYGFKKLSLSSNFQDQSLLRDKVVPEIFREFGVPAPQTSFYRIYINFNGTNKYLGLYTVMEDPKGAMLKKQFTTNTGNLYKPDGNGANFAKDSFTEEGFDKENNSSNPDWSDIKAVFAALHSTSRTTDSAAWRQNLESVFDADLFIKWLAVNTTVQNWDTYGKMAHNYYLYNDGGVIKWIPWDNNFALQGGTEISGIGNINNEVTPEGINQVTSGGNLFPQNITGVSMFPQNTSGGNFIPGNTSGNPFFPGNITPGNITSGGGINMNGGMNNMVGGNSPLSLYLNSSEVGSSWPLIRYLMDDSVYKAKYNKYLKEVITGAFNPSKLQDKYTKYAALIRDYVVGENGETADATYVTNSASFDQAIETLKSHVTTRESAVNNYLNQ